MNPKALYLSLEKEKVTSCVVFTYSIKRTREIGKFHVAFVQRRLRKEQKSVIRVQICFANNSYCLHCKLPIAVIQTFCYHGDVTSHFSLLCSLAVILGFTAVRELNDVAYLLDRSLRSLISSVDMTKFVIPFL